MPSARKLPRTSRWFVRRRIDARTWLLFEPHVAPVIRCNIWYVRGTTRDLLVDTGLGIGDLVAAVSDLIDKPLVVIATHGHVDHVGGLHQFDNRLIHEADIRGLTAPEDLDLRVAAMPRELRTMLGRAGYELGDHLLSAVPEEVADGDVLRPTATYPTRLLEEGDRIDLGDVAFEVLHLPGHSPGSIGLWDATAGVLFSGDAIYDGPLLDDLPGSDVTAYRSTMRRLRGLELTLVHGGHGPSFGPGRLRAMTDAYLNAP